ncbi:MAG: PD-(D/E)XK nuclease family protein [Planctomycetota bacterium]
MQKKRKRTFAHRLVELISEPQFIKFEQMLSEPNIFRIVGRTHYERWHSCFWGWLLDTTGSHLLSNYTLVRLLFLLLDDKCLKAKDHDKQHLWEVLPTIDFSEVEVTPNENTSNETSVPGVGRFDIFLTGKFTDDVNHQSRLNMVVELKIDSKPDGEQSKRYADWLFHNHPNDINVLIYVTPRLKESSKATVGDVRWYCLDYQLLNDKLLLPLLDHPMLNEKVKPFIIQYVKNLKIRYKGIKMAITNEEKRMAVALYEKYSDVFDSIYDALVSTGTIDYSTSNVVPDRGRESGRIAVKINGRVFSNETLKQLLEDVLKYLVDNNLLGRLPMPWGTSKQRFIITTEEPAKHPNGKNFFYPVRYKGYTMESHYARERGIQVLGNLCSKLELEYEQIET